MVAARQEPMSLWSAAGQGDTRISWNFSVMDVRLYIFQHVTERTRGFKSVRKNSRRNMQYRGNKVRDK